MVPGDTTARQNAMEGIRRKSYSSSDIEGEEESVGYCGGFDSQKD